MPLLRINKLVKITLFLQILLLSSSFSSGMHYTNSDEFGTSQRIPGVEGNFAVIATDNNGGVYIAYQSVWDQETGKIDSYHIFFSYSHDYGKSWSVSKRIDDNGSSFVYCDTPGITVDKNTGTIYVIWKDDRDGVAKVYLDKSTDGGVTFGIDKVVDDWDGDFVPTWLPFTTSIAAIDDVIHITWISYNGYYFTNASVQYTKSTNGGDTFSEPLSLEKSDGLTRFAFPSITIDPINTQNLYLVYSKREPSIAYVYLRESNDDGSSFTPSVQVNDGTTQTYTGGPQIAITSKGEVHAVWSENRAGQGSQFLDIYYAYSSNGSSFSSNIKVNDDTVIESPTDPTGFTKGVQGTPAIAIDNEDEIHVMWEDFRNFENVSTYCRDTYYAYKIPGDGFSENIKVNYVNSSVPSVNSADPRFIFDNDDNLFIVYSDDPSGDNTHHSIYFMSILHENDSKQGSINFNYFGSTIIELYLIVLIFNRDNFKTVLKGKSSLGPPMK